MKKNLNVLLVEDNPGDARLVREMLRESPSPRFNLTHVRHLQAAMDLVQSENFDVLLLDLLLDDSPRLATLMEVYELACRVPTVILSGLNDKAVTLWTMKEGAEDFLVKDGLDAAE